MSNRQQMSFFDKEILLKDFLGYDGGEGSFLFGNNLTKEFVQTKDIIENHVSRGRSRARSDIPDFRVICFPMIAVAETECTA